MPQGYSNTYMVPEEAKNTIHSLHISPAGQREITRPAILAVPKNKTKEAGIESQRQRLKLMQVLFLFESPRAFYKSAGTFSETRHSNTAS